MRQEGASIGKIHSSVQQMIAEAREIVKPTQKMPSFLSSSNSHLQLHLPNHHINDHLREILHLSPDGYNKIIRPRRKSSHKLVSNEKSQDSIAKKPEDSKDQAPLLLTKLTNRYQLKSIINNFQSELVDHKFHQSIRKHRRPLYHKKTISLLPEVSELPVLKHQSKSMHKAEESSVEKLATPTPKIYLTITQNDLIKARERRKVKQYKTIEETYPKMLRQFIQLSNSRSKHTSPPKEQQIRGNSQKKFKNNAKASKKKELAKQEQPEEQKYEPWLYQSQEAQINF